MPHVSRREWPILVVGDLLAFSAALWVTLALRYLEVPSADLLTSHFLPFSILFFIWVAVYFIAGLYDKHTTLFKRFLPQYVLQAQTVNIILAAIFFFLLPSFGIAPKTNLIIYLAASSVLITLWRLYVFSFFGVRRRAKAIVIGAGKELQELVEEVNGNDRYHLEFVEVFDTGKVQNPNDLPQAILKRVMSGGASIIVAPTHGKHLDALVPLFHNLLFIQSHVDMLDFGRFYEEVFDRVPLSLVNYDWFLENIESKRRSLYGVAKFLIDMFFALVVLAFLAAILPVIFIAHRLSGGGPLFLRQERIGKNGKKITVMKLRTMTGDDSAAWIGETQNRVTKLGALLRTSSLDEFPQVFSVLKGDLSFIGPRSDVAGLAERLAQAIPFYNARYAVTPGISGWAQVNQRYAPGKISPQSIEESRVRLAYDLYYLKHRSLVLDLVIALRTVKTLMGRFGKLFVR